MTQQRIRKQWAGCTPHPDSVEMVRQWAEKVQWGQGRVVDDLVAFAVSKGYKPGMGATAIASAPTPKPAKPSARGSKLCPW